MASGLFVSTVQDTSGRRQSKTVRAAVLAWSDQLARYGEFCRSLGETPTAVALAWLLHQPSVTSTINGAASQTQPLLVLHMPSFRLGGDCLAAIDAIFPSIGPAPETYGW